MLILCYGTRQNVHSCAFVFISSSTQLSSDYMFVNLTFMYFSSNMNSELNVYGLISQVMCE